MPEEKLKLLQNKAKQVKLIALDIDGTLTDGTIWMSGEGEIIKAFNAKDGLGLRKAEESGIKIFLITARKAADAVKKRMEDLKIPAERLFESVKDKVLVANQITKQENTELQQISFMGDDEQDLPLLKVCGFSAAPKDAVKKVLQSVDYISGLEGGRGAVREVIDFILESKV
jgi:3-deoxy-D-manno-octulosonate 8-phosphate phosphatase (KDO 8-P phosphatase)